MSPVRRRFLGLPLDDVTLEEAVAFADGAVREKTPCTIIVLNAGKSVSAQRDPELREALEQADLVPADGLPVVWASRWLGDPVRERVAGVDLMDALAGLAARRGYGLFLYGARPEVVRRAAEALAERHPGLRVAGVQDGYHPADQDAAVADRIRASGADIVLIGMPSPRKERFLAEHGARLGAPVRMGVGGSFDVVAGLVRRAPVWMQKAGCEWLFRLGQEPGRMWRRYLIGNSRFLWLVLRARMGG